MANTTLTGRPIYDIDFSDPQVNRNPYPHFDAMRAMAPLVFNPQTGWWLATSFDNAKAVLGGEDVFGPVPEYFDQLFGARVFEAEDQPRHDEVRAIWKPHFLRAALASYTDAVERVVDELLDVVIPRLQDGEVVDVSPEFLNPLPAHVIAIIVGAPREDFALFEKWNRDIGRLNEAHTSDDSDFAQGARAAGSAANTALRNYFAEQIEDRRRLGSTDDLVGIMAHADYGLEEEQRRAHLVQLLWAGSETTTKHLAHTMVTLGRHPDQRKLIQEDRSLVPQALEESLRYEAVAGSMLRRAREDVTIGDVTVPAGELAAGYIPAGNRDPARWEHADEFDVMRPAKAHLGYGTGIHSCLGVQLARLEGRIWLNKVLDRMPDWVVATDDIDYGINIMSRGPVGVPISLS